MGIRRLVVSVLVLLCAGVLWAAPAASAGPLAWSAPALIDHQPPFSDPSFLNGVPCPATGLRAAWQAEQPAPELNLQDVSCASSALCAAVDREGRGLVGTAP